MSTSLKQVSLREGEQRKGDAFLSVCLFASCKCSEGGTGSVAASADQQLWRWIWEVLE